MGRAGGPFHDLQRWNGPLNQSDRAARTSSARTTKRSPLHMFEQTFKNIDDILHKDAGCTSELDYTEQSPLLLSLKYLAKEEREQRALGRQHNND